MDDKRELVVHSLKLGYKKINDLNAFTRKINSAKAILKMRRDHVKHTGEAIITRLQTKLALLHNLFDRELSSIVESKLKFLDDTINDVLDSQCLVSEVCMEAQRILKHENEDILNNEADCILDKFVGVLTPDVATDVYENLIELGFKSGDCDALLDQNVLGYLLTKDKVATPVMVPITLSKCSPSLRIQNSPGEGDAGHSSGMQEPVPRNQSCTLQDVGGRAARGGRESGPQQLPRVSMEMRLGPSPICPGSRRDSMLEGAGDGGESGSTDDCFGALDLEEPRGMPRKIPKHSGREKPGQENPSACPERPGQTAAKVSHHIDRPYANTFQVQQASARSIAGGADQACLQSRGYQRIGSGRIVIDESRHRQEALHGDKTPVSEESKSAVWGSESGKETTPAPSHKYQNKASQNSAVKRLVFNHLGIRMASEEGLGQGNTREGAQLQSKGKRGEEDQHCGDEGRNGSVLNADDAAFNRTPGTRAHTRLIVQKKESSNSGLYGTWWSPSQHAGKNGLDESPVDEKPALEVKMECPSSPEVLKSNRGMAMKAVGAAWQTPQQTVPVFDLASCMSPGKEAEPEFLRKLSAGFHFSTGVTENSCGDVIVADTGSNAVKVLRDGCLLFEIPKDVSQQVNFRRPSAVVTNAKDDIIVKDDNCIHLFDKNGHFKMCMGKGELRRPYGLALTDEGKILVLDTSVRKHQLFHFDQETGKATIYKFMPLWGLADEDSKCRFLAYSHGKVLVSDLGKSLMYLTTETGQALRTFGGYGRGLGQLNQPSGVAVDGSGNWLVGDSRNDRLQIFRPNGDFLCKLRLPIVLKRPSGIFLNRRGLLLVIHYLDHVISVFHLPS